MARLGVFERAILEEIAKTAAQYDNYVAAGPGPIHRRGETWDRPLPSMDAVFNRSKPAPEPEAAASPSPAPAAASASDKTFEDLRTAMPAATTPAPKPAPVPAAAPPPPPQVSAVTPAPPPPASAAPPPKPPPEPPQATAAPPQSASPALGKILREAAPPAAPAPPVAAPIPPPPPAASPALHKILRETPVHARPAAPPAAAPPSRPPAAGGGAWHSGYDPNLVRHGVGMTESKGGAGIVNQGYDDKGRKLSASGDLQYIQKTTADYAAQHPDEFFRQFGATAQQLHSMRPQEYQDWFKKTNTSGRKFGLSNWLYGHETKAIQDDIAHHGVRPEQQNDYAVMTHYLGPDKAAKWYAGSRVEAPGAGSFNMPVNAYLTRAARNAAGYTGRGYWEEA